jgi:NADPH:quinone reductase-like Zn-dependent oxidoreductase
MSRQLRALVLSAVVGQRLTMFVGTVRAADLDRLCVLIGDGAVTPSLHRTYPLAEAPVAMRRLEAGESRGKVAIQL